MTWEAHSPNCCCRGGLHEGASVGFHQVLPAKTLQYVTIGWVVPDGARYAAFCLGRLVPGDSKWLPEVISRTDGRLSGLYRFGIS